MTRALLALLLVLGQFPVAAAARRRAVRHSPPAVAPAVIVAAARQAAEAALTAGVPAVQIAVSEGGRIIYSEAFGISDKESATAATPRSVMQIGSVTKQFAAAAILRLAERGALTLDDPIEKFVPEFNPRGETITLRQLLSHRSGVPSSWWPPSGGFPLHAPVTREQVIAGINGQPLAFKPGSKWSYSNAGYMLVGYAIESIAGISFAEFVHREFALPLGLLDTGVCGTFGVPLPEGYGLSKAGELKRMQALHSSGVIGDGSLCSTASDLARWSHLLATGRVLLPASYATMTTRPAPVPAYGLGLDLRNIAGHPAVSHGGSIDGFQTYLIYFAHKEIAVAVITNVFPSPTMDAENIALAVASAAVNTP
ncbi:MAG TPA: serine hydrolase domain-containing protein [Thermoanaerobaculia bacterium]